MNIKKNFKRIRVEKKKEKEKEEGKFVYILCVINVISCDNGCVSCVKLNHSVINGLCIKIDLSKLLDYKIRRR